MTDPALEREALQLFEQLLELAEPDRDAWLAARTADRPELARRVAAMRAADRRAELRTGAALETVDETAAPEQIGAYKITDRIGRGGMGSVYRGERMTGDFAHIVAIKVIKPGLLSEALVERFRRERQLLAQLSHPNIAQLYDGGETETGAPYIIMEHVDGLPLLDWIETRQPDRALRQRVFAEICTAVAVAHRNLIVHRDLTPSNVLITASDTPKVIDFGIAKIVDGEPAGESLDQSLGGLSFTPGYAAPERLTTAQVTTAVDIFSLGKLLERLLPPGTRDHELKAIIAKATASDPRGRYATADALGEDVRSWSRGFPVKAAHAGHLYAVRKFVGRHWLSVSAAAAAIALLLTALGLTLQAYSRAETARQAEVKRFEELRSLAHYMLFDLNGQLERVVGNTQARATLADEAQRYLAALAASSNVDDALRLEAARGFTVLARAQGVPGQPNLGDADKARASLQAATSILQDVRDQSVDVVSARADAMASRAMIEAHTDADTDTATVTLAEAERELIGVPKDNRNERWHGARRNLRKSQLELTTLTSQPAEMARLAALLAAEIDEWPATMRTSRLADLDRAYALHYRGLAHYFADELEEGVATLLETEQRLLDLDRALPNDPETLYTLAWTGYVGYGVASGLPARSADADHFLDLAWRTSERLIQIEANDNALRSFAGNIRQIQAQALSSQGRHADAIAMQREVIALYEAATGPKRLATPLNRLANAEVTMGNIARAAEDRALACASYKAARSHMAELEARGELFGFVERHREGLDANIERCARNAPLSEMTVFE